ncbi:MAG: M28 family peptidase [Calditrichia bacterium]|nr:M28 family peptidase [Calditrichia bacterium]
MLKRMGLMLLITIFLFPVIGLSQVLLNMNDDGINSLDQSRILWQDSRENTTFVLVPYLEDVAKIPGNYEILDEDVEGNQYFWIYAMGPETINGIPFDENVLWRANRTALIKAQNTQILSQLPRFFKTHRINFRRSARAPELAYSPLPGGHQESFQTIQAIIDSVNIDSIYQTERHISGEESFYMDGVLDSIQSRNSNNPQIFKAQNYLKMRLENLGYAVELHPFGSAGTFYDVKFAPGQVNSAWAITTDRIYGTADAGLSWTAQYEGSAGADLWSVFPVDNQIVFAVGDFGTILKTTNGGSSWSSQNSPVSNFLFGVYFSDTNLGWIAGDNGNIMKSTDGGSTWIMKSVPTSNRLYDIYFADQSQGWAVGRSGTIVHSSDGGETWQPQSSGTSSRLYGVHFLNPDTGFVVGWDGRLLRTENGGTNWTIMSVPTSSYLYGIDFIDDQNGIVAGWNGTCLKTVDGGDTWTTAGSMLGENAYSVDYVDPQILWCSGDGLFAKSDNSATTWQSQLHLLPDASLNNVLTTKIGTTYPDQYYIICAHYDDMPSGPVAPGADDNGSGTAAVIEAARILAPYNFKYSIRFVLFSGEEQGLVGSQAYASQAAAAGDQILGALNMDMIGYDGNNDGRMEIHAGTMLNSQIIGNLMVANISTFQLPLVADYLTSGSSGASDHASFWSAGYPAIMHIEDFQDFTPYYHTVNDLLSTLRQSYFHDNAKLTIGTLAMLAQLDGEPTGLPQQQLPRDFVLSEPYPNPFNPVVHLRYHLPFSDEVSVDVYDVLGKRVKSIVNEIQKAGWHQISWDSQNDAGAAVSSGIYLIRIHTNYGTRMKKVILMR